MIRKTKEKTVEKDYGEIANTLIGPDKQYPRILFYVPVAGLLSAQAHVDFDSFEDRDHFLMVWRRSLKRFLEEGWKITHV